MVLRSEKAVVGAGRQAKSERGWLTASLVALGVLVSGVTGCSSRATVESLEQQNRGVLLATQKQFPDAIKHLKQATVLDPSNHQAFLNLAIVHMEMRKFEKAKDDLQNAIRVEPGKAAYQEKLGTVLIELKEWDGAKKALEATIESEPNLFKAHYKLAQVLEQLDDQQNALRSYTTAIERGPRFLPAYNNLARLYADLLYFNEATQVAQSALRVAQTGSEDEASIHNILGTVYQQQRNFDSSIAEFKQALQIVPGMQSAVFSLGWTYATVGNKEEAKRYLKKFLSGGGEMPAHYKKAARDKLSELTEGF